MATAEDTLLRTVTAPSYLLAPGLYLLDFRCFHSFRFGRPYDTIAFDAHSWLLLPLVAVATVRSTHL